MKHRQLNRCLWLPLHARALVSATVTAAAAAVVARAMAARIMTAAMNKTMIAQRSYRVQTYASKLQCAVLTIDIILMN